jgi:formaldehyde-activating enzyme involved in methanogenesis
MTTHTNARLTRAGQRIIETEDGLPLFQAFSSAVGTAVADANEARLIEIWHTHSQVVADCELWRQNVEDRDKIIGKLVEALKYARRMVKPSECDLAFIDAAMTADALAIAGSV